MSRGEKPPRGRTNNWFHWLGWGTFGALRSACVAGPTRVWAVVRIQHVRVRGAIAGGHAKFWFTLTAVLLIWGPGWGTLGALQAACAAGSTWVWVFVRTEPFMRRRATRQKQFLVHVDGCFSALGPGMGEAGVFRASRRRGAVVGVDFPRE